MGGPSSIVAFAQRCFRFMLGDGTAETKHRNGMNNDATRWTLDPGHSMVGFSVRHMMITNVRGLFHRFTADVRYDAKQPEDMRIDASIDIASIDTNEPARDGYLKSDLFFDTEKHPAMTFVSKSARSVGAGALEITGDLTIHGTTHTAVLAVSDISAVTRDMRGNERIGATATTKIKRADYGITWNKTLEAGTVVLGEIVTITLDISLVKAS